eukprot:76445-Chlamydomonas_euryale.AAC.6
MRGLGLPDREPVQYVSVVGCVGVGVQAMSLKGWAHMGMIAFKYCLVSAARAPRPLVRARACSRVCAQHCGNWRTGTCLGPLSSHAPARLAPCTGAGCGKCAEAFAGFFALHWQCQPQHMYR